MVCFYEGTIQIGSLLVDGWFVVALVDRVSLCDFDVHLVCRWFEVGVETVCFCLPNIPSGEEGALINTFVLKALCKSVIYGGEKTAECRIVIGFEEGARISK